MDISTKRTTFGADNQSWLGSAHATDAGVTITVDTSTFTGTTHYPDGYLPSGLPLSQRSDGLYGLAEAGKCDGFLLTPTAVPSGTKNVGASLFLHGTVREAKLPVPLSAAQKSAVQGPITFIEEVNHGS